MATAVLTVRLPEEIKARLDKLAQATHRSRSFLAEEAIARWGAPGVCPEPVNGWPHYPFLIPCRVKVQRVEILRMLHASRKWPQGFEAL